MQFISFTDKNGRPFVVETLDFYDQLRTRGFLLFGMNIDCILEMRRQYILRSGPLFPTVGLIKELFEKEK